MNNISIPNYEIKGILGEGGMAVVYLAEHQLFHSKVAVKVLNREFVHNENIRKRFISEARNMFKMSHPNIVRVTDMIDQEQTVAFVMEYIEGESLKEYLDRKGKLGDEQIKYILSQMLDALEYVHGQGLVHRDIKPSNFMLTPQGKVMLMDFGIAKQLNPGSSEYTSTGTNQQMGTAMYMSPEQIHETKSVTPQSDIYSLGVVLWQMLTGQKPYIMGTLSTFQLQTKIVTEPLPVTNTAWDGIIQRATEKEVEKRYRDAKEFKEALRRAEKSNAQESTRIEDKPEFERKGSSPITNSASQGFASTTTKKIKPLGIIISMVLILGIGYLIWKENKASIIEDIPKDEVVAPENKTTLEFSPLPTIETVSVSSVFQREALSGGKISSDGGFELWAKGIVWSKVKNPDISLITKTNEGANSENYISKLTNLQPDTRYYVRAYATNRAGTGYGQEQTFMTEREAAVFSGSVSIGAQVWQTKNLNVDRFRNGDIIPEAKSGGEWSSVGKKGQPAWCYYENKTSNGSIYGKLYNWYAINDSRGICPEGWHIPNNSEWTTLTNFLGGGEVAGGKMKMKGINYWHSPNSGATNSSGFSALPGGSRSSDLTFNNGRSEVFFWSTTEFNINNAWYIYISTDDPNTGMSHGTDYPPVFNLASGKSSGLSVRCIKD
jgi:uncharacterized protein (TIGR02145 family)